MPVNNKIKIRRGNNIDLPAGGTESGELRYSIDTKELYIDDGSLNIKIGGDPYAFPVSTATQSALNGKQPVGNYSTDIHSNITALNAVSNTNTGDETLTSIKTKLGAATSVSDGYLRYQDFALLHTPTTVTASNGLSISGQNISLQDASLTQSGALTFNDWNTFNSKEPSFSKNSGFNLPLGTTPGTVLAGRTFGTAANSAVGDFIQNQNSLKQTASMWITGIISSSNPNETFRSVNSTNNAYSARFKSNGGDVYFGIENSGGDFFGASPFESVIYSPVNNLFIKTPIAKFTGAAIFSSTVNSTGFLLNGNNLTSSLSTNYIPKWNGSNFVNATAGTDYQLPITLTTNGTSGAATFENGVMNVPNYGGGIGTAYTSTFTPITGLTSATFHNAKYTKVGSVYDASVSAHLVTNVSSGTCTFRFTLPSTPIDGTKIHIWGTIYEQYHAYVVNYWLLGGTSTYQDISFTTASASGTDFNAIFNCKYE